MKTVFVTVGVLLVSVLCGLALWRWSDHKADEVERLRLLAFQPLSPARFDASMVAALPDPARRYFAFTIAPGTPLHTVAEISMTGQFSLPTDETAGYMSMTAEQTLASPHGFVWKMSASRGMMRISGSDSGSWTRFWFMGLIPVVRLGGDPDHARSAYGRYVAESVIWSPAALLPRPGIDWAHVDDTTARVTVTEGELSQSVEVTVDDAGRPVIVRFPRWSDVNADRKYRVQTFGGALSEFRTFSGFTLPTHVEGGYFFGTDDYFPFFKADVRDIRFSAGAMD